MGVVHVLVVSFAGKTAAPGGDAGFRIWSYKIEAVGSGSGGELSSGRRIALGLPSGVHARGAEAFPGVPQLAGVFVLRDPDGTRQYVGRQIGSPGTQFISFVAPVGETVHEMLFATAPIGQNLSAVSFATSAGGNPEPVQVLAGPVTGPPVFNGRPAADFTGALPYASEIFGVYQPLAGWFGANNTQRVARGLGEGTAGARTVPERTAFAGQAARTLEEDALSALAVRLGEPVQGVLSPVGVVNLFRQYFFEFDSFLGAPAGHLWLSPGGTVEMVETSTRRVLVERTAEQSEESTRKVEESLTEKDDLADAVKEDNANDTKLGISATGGVNAGIYHGEASASFSVNSTVKTSSERTHKHSRTQSAKVSSEIKRNFKTTFKSVTESTDTSSRRYLVQNTTSALVNYEMRRKMRKVGVQVQHIGTRLCWQVYLDDPGRSLGLGDMVHLVEAPDLTGIREPERPPPLVVKTTQFTGGFPVRKKPGTDNAPEANMEFVHHFPEDADGITNHANDVHAVARMDFTPPPPEQGYKIAGVRLVAVAPGRSFAPHLVRPAADKNSFAVFSLYFNSGDLSPIGLTFEVTWEPPPTNDAHRLYAEEKKVYDAAVAELQRTAFAAAVRDRVKLVSAMRTRSSDDLRSEERQTVYGSLIDQLRLFADPHLGSELIRQIFDVDEMLYFVAPDYWRPDIPQPPQDPPPPRPGPGTRGRYPIPDPPGPSVLNGRSVASWYSYTDKTNGPLDAQLETADEWRVNYLITEDTQPAPRGSSLGWLIQADGDVRRNEFLNAAWAKAVLPVRPGHELEALAWLDKADVEGEAGLGLPYPFQPGDPADYQGLTVGEVLKKLAAKLQQDNTVIGNTLATEEVFETGFDPLDGGFRPAEPYQIFDQWVEVLPTDQVAALEVKYNPLTGQQI